MCGANAGQSGAEIERVERYDGNESQAQHGEKGAIAEQAVERAGARAKQPPECVTTEGTGQEKGTRGSERCTEPCEGNAGAHAKDGAARERERQGGQPDRGGGDVGHHEDRRRERDFARIANRGADPLWADVLIESEDARDRPERDEDHEKDRETQERAPSGRGRAGRHVSVPDDVNSDVMMPVAKMSGIPYIAHGHV